MNNPKNRNFMTVTATFPYKPKYTETLADRFMPTSPRVIAQIVASYVYGNKKYQFQLNVEEEFPFDLDAVAIRRDWIDIPIHIENSFTLSSFSIVRDTNASLVCQAMS